MAKRTNPTSTSLLKDYLVLQAPGTPFRKRDLHQYLRSVAPWISDNTPYFTVSQAIEAGALRETDKRNVVVTSKRAVRAWEVHKHLPEDHNIGKNSKRVPGKPVNTKPKQLDLPLVQPVKQHVANIIAKAQKLPAPTSILLEKTCRYASIEQLQDAALLIMIELAYRARSK